MPTITLQYVYPIELYTLTQLLLHMLREDGTEKMYQKCDEILCYCFPEIEPYFSDVHVAIILGTLCRLSVSLHRVVTLLFSILP